MADGADQAGLVVDDSQAKNTEPRGSRLTPRVRMLLIVLVVTMTGLAPEQMDVLLLLI